MDEFVKIYRGEGAYIWVVTDQETYEVWVFYDGASAYRFADKHRATTGHKAYCDTKPIVDLQDAKPEHISALPLKKSKLSK